MNKIINIIKNIDFYIGPTIVTILLIDVILQVLSRILPGNSISWTLELAEMMLGALIWFGVSVGVANGAHVGFDLVTKKLPKKFKKGFGLLSNTLFLVYLGMLAVFTNDLLNYYTKLHSKSTILGVSMYWVRMPILIGCIFAIIRLLIKQYRVLTNKEEMFVDTFEEEFGSKGDVE